MSWEMIEPMRIREQMEVIDHSGHRVGIVNGVINDLILLARSGAGDLHHCVPLDRVAALDETRIRLK
jgi:hypothetical protein